MITCTCPTKQEALAEAARRGAETRRTNKLLGQTSYGQLLAALRDAQEANDRAKDRAADGLRRREYNDGSRYSGANYYRSRRARDHDYYEKRIAISNAVKLATEAGVKFGWRRDGSLVPWVVYFEVPTGQVSFHDSTRGEGSDYDQPWDGVRNASGERISSAIEALVATPTESEHITFRRYPMNQMSVTESPMQIPPMGEIGLDI